MENKLLFAGAKLYRYYGSRIEEIITIDRVTKTQAIAGSFKFKIELSSDGIAKKIPNTESWSFSIYYLETPELIEQYFRQQAIEKLSVFNYKNVSTESLKQILAIIEKETKK